MNRSRLLHLAHKLESKDENLQVIVDFRGGSSPKMDHFGGTSYARIGQHESYANTPALVDLRGFPVRVLAAEPRHTYAIGYRDDCGSYGMFYGPTENLQTCLDYRPDDHEARRVCYIIEFDNGASGSFNRIVARWRPSASSWVLRG